MIIYFENKTFLLKTKLKKPQDERFFHLGLSVSLFFFRWLTGLRMSLKWVGSQGLGKKPRHRRGFLGCTREKNSPVLCFPAWRGCLSRPVGEELARLRGVQCWPGVGLRDWSHSAVFQKEQGEEGKTSPDTHWVAAGWPGLLVQQGQCQVVRPSQPSPGIPPQSGQG